MTKPITAPVEFTPKELIHAFYALREYGPQNRAVKNATLKVKIALKRLGVEL